MENAFEGWKGRGSMMSGAPCMVYVQRDFKFLSEAHQVSAQLPKELNVRLHWGRAEKGCQLVIRADLSRDKHKGEANEAGILRLKAASRLLQIDWEQPGPFWMSRNTWKQLIA